MCQRNLLFLCSVFYIFLSVNISVYTDARDALDYAGQGVLREAEMDFHPLSYKHQRPIYTHNAPSQPRMHFTL